MFAGILFALAVAAFFAGLTFSQRQYEAARRPAVSGGGVATLVRQRTRPALLTGEVTLYTVAVVAFLASQILGR